MRNELTEVVEGDGEWFIAYVLEVPGVNGQGRTRDEAIESLREAVKLILADRREDGLRGLPADVDRETVVVGEAQLAPATLRRHGCYLNQALRTRCG